MSRIVTNIILAILAMALVIAIVLSVKAPIDQKNEIEEVDAAVILKLEDIKRAQMTYKEMNDSFASSFEDLINGIRTGKVKTYRKLGGRAADTLQEVKVETIIVDAMTYTFNADYPLDLLGKVPPSNSYDFEMKVSRINQNNIDIPVFMVADPKPLNPLRTLTLGSLNEAKYTGNWK